jgi:twitching motility protein PilT
VLIGEMRDLETIQAAITIAETGHLTFATLHTNSAAQTINRIIDVFPPHQQDQVRTQLSMNLEGIVTQACRPRPRPRLLPGGGGADPYAAIRHLIAQQIYQICFPRWPGKIRDDHVQPVAGQLVSGAYISRSWARYVP